MRSTLLLAVAACLILLAGETISTPATNIKQARDDFEIARLAAEVQRRANPTGSYAPSYGTCPTANGARGFIRDARNNVINPTEADYVNRHRTATQQAWRTWLSSNPGPNLDGANGIPGGVQNYTNTISNLPRVGIALSGGGYRAMIHGSGYLMGLDLRNTTAQQRGTAGFLQLANYVAGLSGGSWAVGSLALADWPTAQNLAENTWDLSQDLIVPTDNTISYYTSIVGQVADRRNAGFPTAITDYWGRALSYHLVNSTYPNEGEGTTFSDIRNVSNFASAAFPFPVVIADEREAGELLIYRNTTSFEFTPYEFGSWDPRVSAFIPIDILGTNLTNGTSTQLNNNCTFGFENFGWVVGTSSTLFNGLYNMVITSSGSNIIKGALAGILGSVSNQNNDVSVLPNPFTGWSSGIANSTIGSLPNITLVDGGEDLQNIPLDPLLQPARGLDFILAVDSSADETDWPNGTAIRETYLRYAGGGPEFNTVAMPDIPSQNTFINRGLNTRPVFFGCSATVNVTNSATAGNGTKAPLIAYVANYPWTALTNVSTFQLRYSMNEAQSILDNAVNVATLGGISNGSIYWPTCLACAALERSFERSNTVRPSVCTTCLNAYCWDGVTNDTAPSTPYSPPVGTPAWVTSQGQIQEAPRFTGGDGSNAQQGGSTSNAATIQLVISIPTMAITIALASLSSLLLL